MIFSLIYSETGGLLKRISNYWKKISNIRRNCLRFRRNYKAKINIMWKTVSFVQNQQTYEAKGAYFCNRKDLGGDFSEKSFEFWGNVFIEWRIWRWRNEEKMKILLIFLLVIFRKMRDGFFWMKWCELEESMIFFFNA